MVSSLKNNDKNWTLVIGVFFLIASVILRYLALAQTSYANGWDGYYYVMQAHSWLNYGHLQSPDYSLIYPYFIILSYFTGNYELAYKLGSTLLGGILIFTTYVFILRVSKRITSAILAASFLLFSPTLTYEISQFPKNVMGIIVLLLFLLSVSHKNIRISILILLISIFTHRMVAGLCIIIALIYVARYLHWKWIVAGIISIILISLLPGILHYSDLSRFKGQFQLIPQFTPYSFFSIFRGVLSPVWVFELILISILIIITLITLFNKKTLSSTALNKQYIWSILLLISVLPIFKMSFGSMGYRFFMLAPILFPIYILSSVKIKNNWSILLSLALIIISLFSYRSYNPKYFDPPNKLYEIIVSRISNDYSPKKYPLIIAHKSLAEMIIYKTDFDALNWQPPKNIDEEKVLRVINGIDLIYLTKYISKNELLHVRKLTQNYYITTESIWNKFISQVISNNDQKLLHIIKEGNNPLDDRPYFLSKGKDL